MLGQTGMIPIEAIFLHDTKTPHIYPSPDRASSQLPRGGMRGSVNQVQGSHVINEK